jgi:hypothetical protein
MLTGLRPHDRLLDRPARRKAGDKKDDDRDPEERGRDEQEASEEIGSH